jgi:hypothetical protein
LSGRAFNIGGGSGNTVSLLELIGRLEELLERPVALSFDVWRADRFAGHRLLYEPFGLARWRLPTRRSIDHSRQACHIPVTQAEREPSHEVRSVLSLADI